MLQYDFVYLTEKEIEDIEKLNQATIRDYIKDMPEEKKRLVMKQYNKEMEIKQWKTVAMEKYN